MNISKSTPRPQNNSNGAKNYKINNDNDNRIKIERSNKYYGQRDEFEIWFCYDLGFNGKLSRRTFAKGLCWRRFGTCRQSNLAHVLKR